MAYQIRYTLNVDWVGDGCGSMSVAIAQTKGFSQTGAIQVPGGDTPTQGNFNTALSGSSATPAAGSMSNDLSTQIATALAQLQAFATGGG